ncbi:MAG TPA: hypothetical protein VGJ23_06740 [Gaiellaceae bacterium]|jgi:hypothetical protein
MKRAALLAVVACLCAACGSQSSSRATLKPTTFVRHVDNQWFPLTPGTVFVYRGVNDGEPGRDVVTVTSRTKVIQGVHCSVVDDRLFVSGHLAERTADWYAQDKQGNVWYFGEDTAELDKSGKVTSREGSWQSGVDGARAGILIPAHPKIGQTFLQEYYKGHAEDHSQVLSLSASIRVPYTSSEHALLTKEWTPLEPDVLDHKVYISGIGMVKEETVKGGEERFVLVSVRRR